MRQEHAERQHGLLRDDSVAEGLELGVAGQAGHAGNPASGQAHEPLNERWAQALAGSPSHVVVRRGITLVPEGRLVFPQMTVMENLQLGAHIKERNQVAQLVDYAYTLFPRLFERRGQLAGSMSGGEQQMLAIARGLMSEPRVVLMDEPSMGLAPLMVQEIARTIRALREEGVTIVLVEQMAAVALQLADRAYVLENGRVKLSGSGAELARTPEVKQAYLGG